MKKLVLFIVLLTNITASESVYSITAKAYFSPKGGAEIALIKELDSAKRTILVQAYSFTNDTIATALVRASLRGVKVVVILDRSNINGVGSDYKTILNANIPTYIDYEHKIAHNKIVIIDSYTLVTGSYNFSRSAEYNNAENMVIMKTRKLSKIYLDNFNIHKAHSNLQGQKNATN